MIDISKARFLGKGLIYLGQIWLILNLNIPWSTMDTECVHRGVVRQVCLSQVSRSSP